MGAAWLLGLAAALRLIDGVAGASPLAAAFIGAFLVDLGTGRAGVRWFAERENVTGRARKKRTEVASRGRRATARLVGLGAAVAGAATLAVLAMGVVSGHASMTLGHPSAAALLMMAKVFALAVRDELLLRGLPLFTARRAGIAPNHAVAFAALASPAAMVLSPGVTPEAVAMACASGATFALLWSRTGSAVPAIVAHATWGLLTGSVLRGDVVVLTFDSGVFSSSSRAAGVPAWLFAATFAGAALFVAWRIRQADFKTTPAATDG